MFSYALVLKLLLKIHIVVLVLALAVEKSLNRWCDTTGNAILNPAEFSPLSPQIVTVVALAGLWLCRGSTALASYPQDLRGRVCLGWRQVVAKVSCLCGERSYLTFSSVPQQHLMSSSSPIQTGHASHCPALLAVCQVHPGSTLELQVLLGSGIWLWNCLMNYNG